MYKEMLEEMILLLRKSGNQHWADWFQTAYELYRSGQAKKSYTKTLGAYGGMGSFNDVFWNLHRDDFDRLEDLKSEIWAYTKSLSQK